jgi:molybdate transport repressor ModE-like protein
MLSGHVPDLRALELLLTVANTGSLGAAARQHAVSQPAVTARIQGLERLVGLPLVQRSARGSALTPAGALLADWARGVVAAAETLDAGIAALRERRDARLRLAASLTVAEYLLPTWLAIFAREHPDTTVSLTAVNSTEVARLVRTSAVDLGFIEGPTVPEGLSARDVAADRLAVVVAPEHPWARRRQPLSGAELRQTHLVQREPESGTRAALNHALARFGPPVPPLLELSTTTAVRSAAAAGAGPAVLSRLAVVQELEAHRLVEVPVDDAPLDRVLRAVWPRGARPSGPARSLLAIAARSAPRRTASRG